MKILIIHNSYFFPGGEDEVVKSEKVLLESYGHDVFVYERSNKEVESLSRIRKSLFILINFFFSFKTYFELKSIIKRFKPDIAHIHNTFYVISPSVFKVCRECKVPVVMTVHNYRFLCAAATFYRQGKICHECSLKDRSPAVVHRCFKDSKIQTILLNSLIQKYYADGLLKDNVRRFIVTSDFTRQLFIQEGWPPQKLIVKPHFVEFQENGDLKKEKYALFVGALQDYKGIKALIEVWKSYQIPCVLKIVGDGPLRQEIVNAIQGSVIEYLGQKQHQEVRALMRKASFLVMPSECYETFARVIIEAYACATAVIAPAHGPMKELVKDGQTGYLFKPGNHKDLAEKIHMMLSNKNQQEAMGKQAFLEYRQRYTPEINYADLLRIYHEAQ